MPLQNSTAVVIFCAIIWFADGVYVKNDFAGSLQLRDKYGAPNVTVYFLAPSLNIAVNVSIQNSFGMDLTVIFDVFISVHIV